MITSINQETPLIGFAIYEIPVAGGTLALSPMPGRTRHYAADWQHLQVWRPTMVISMTLMDELARKGAGTLGTDLARAGIAWRHLPVPDFGTPDAGADGLWDVVEKDALDALNAGGKVLVHCFGGCGRSGMAALRLMIAAGEDPDTALTRLRAARHCAVETDAQMAWATAR